MERLTFEGNFCDIAGCRENPCPYNGSCTQREIWERLKAYEDAGISPVACEEARKIEEGLNADDYSVARMVELMAADKDGRVVVLPCKVGDTVYWVHNKAITRCRVYRVQKNRKGIFICLRGDGKSHGAFQADLTIGKTIFLTREEAEFGDDDNG